MHTTLLALFVFALVLSQTQGRCAPRQVKIQYKAASPRELTVREVCAGASCSTPVVTLQSACTEIFCSFGTRCNTCTAVLKASDLPAGSTTSTNYGVFFDDEPKPFYQFTGGSQYSASWLAANGWILGCDTTPRVGCTNRNGCVGQKCACIVNDVALSLQGCYQTYFRQLNAASLGACIDDDTFNGFMPGEVAGQDGPGNSCK